MLNLPNKRCETLFFRHISALVSTSAMVEYSGVDRYKAMKAIYMRRSSLQFEITFVAIKRPCRNWSHDYLPKAYNLVDCWCYDTEVHRISSLFAFFDNQFRFGITELAVMDKLLIYYNFWDVICLSHTDSVYTAK